MPAAYMIVQIKITREEGWPEYRQKVAELFALTWRTLSRPRWASRGPGGFLRWAATGRIRVPVDGGDPPRLALTAIRRSEEAARGRRRTGCLGCAGSLTSSLLLPGKACPLAIILSA